MRKNIRQVISTVVISIFLITFGYLPLTYAVNSNVNQTLYEVTKVIDGDTIEVKIGSKKEKVRLIGIDTPETKHPSKPVQCYGKEASDKAKQMMVGKEVRLEADPTNTNRDKYNRLLRYVYLEDGSFVNELLVQEGYAYAYLKFPFQYKKQFRGYQKEAKVSGKGLWSICEKKPVLKQEPAKTESVQIPQAQPTNQQCLIKGNISSTGNKIYHVPNGAYYSKTIIDESAGEKWFCNEAEAQAAGWRKSLR